MYIICCHLKIKNLIYINKNQSIQKPIKSYFCKTECTQNFVQERWQIYVCSCCRMCTCTGSQTSVKNIQGKTFAARCWQPLPGGCTSNALFVCVWSNISECLTWLCLIDPEGKKKNQFCPPSPQSAEYGMACAHVSIFHAFLVCMPKLPLWRCIPNKFA